MIKLGSMLLLCVSFSAVACDVQPFDAYEEGNISTAVKIGNLTTEQNYQINTTDIDSDGKKDYLLILKSDSNKKPFLGIKLEKGDLKIIKTGYVSVKDGLAQCDTKNNIIFNTK